MLKNYLTGELIKTLRRRKGLRQSDIMRLSSDIAVSNVTLSRVENLRQVPTQDKVSEMLALLEMPYGVFFCPYMEERQEETLVLRRTITQLLYRAENDEAVQATVKDLIESLGKKLDMDSLINRQLYISLKTTLDTISGDISENTLPMIVEGLRITYPEFDVNNYNADVLVLYESELMLSLSRCYIEMDELDLALKILTNTLDGYKKQPISEMFKETTLSVIHNLIVRIFLKKGDFDSALKASEEAVEVAKKQSGNSQLPFSIYLRAVALKKAKGDDTESLPLLKQAYFAFALLKMDGMKMRVLKILQELFGATFKTYGTENIRYELDGRFAYPDGGAVFAVDNIGQLLRQFRLASGAKQVDIYKGICSQSMYSKIESGSRPVPSVFILEALMQRLGRDMSLYIDYFASVEEFEEGRLRMQYLRELSINNLEEAEETLQRLSKLGNLSHGLGKQFLLFSQAMMEAESGDFENYTTLLNDAIRETIPDYSEDRISEFRLTFNECNILNATAYRYIEKGEFERAIAVYDQIKESMDKFYVDESIKARYYLTLMNDMAIGHYNISQYEKGLEFVYVGERMSENYGVLHMLNKLAYRKALSLHKLGRKDEATAYAAMAYYSGHLTMGDADLEALAKFAKEDMGIEFFGKMGFVFHEQKKGTYRN